MLINIIERHRLIGLKIQKAKNLNMFLAVPLAKEAASDSHELMGDLLSYLTQKDASN
ncbi:hypothetical protein [Shewanella violacea]|uniref:hypothetical protein n=1 Tax=Shewanella violacea TaxID=60217 RepID=UPI0003122B13|nr:hypothetical protein [Shewanella violacea]